MNETENHKSQLCSLCGCPPLVCLRVEQVAEVFAVAPMTVRRLIYSGAISARRIGRDWRIDHASLDAYVQRHSEPPGPFPEA